MDSSDHVLLEKKGNVYILKLNKPKANNFSADFVQKINEKLDIVENDDEPCALVTISNLDKFFSTGLDLKFIKTLKNVSDFYGFIADYNRLLGRILVLNCPTVCVVNGYCIAGGATLAFAHDYRFMVPEKAFVCLNEVEMGAVLPPAMMAVTRAKFTVDVQRDMIITAKRFKPKECLERKIVDQLVDPSNILDKAVEFAEKLSEKSKFRANYGNLKKQMYERDYLECYNRGMLPEFNESVQNFLNFAAKL